MRPSELKQLGVIVYVCWYLKVDATDIILNYRLRHSYTVKHIRHAIDSHTCEYHIAT